MHFASEMHIIPLNLMFGSKQPEVLNQKTIIEEDWRWTHPTYVISFNKRLIDLVKAEIDPSKRMADVDRKNNLIELHW